jgi:hypothetical protein
MFLAKNYFNLISQNLFLTVASNLNCAVSPRFSMLSAGIEGIEIRQSQFLYLLLLTKNFPYMARKHPTKKKNYKPFTIKHETGKISSFFGKYREGYLFDRLYHFFMAKQLSPEFPSIKLQPEISKIITWNSPLYAQTFGVQISENLFIDDIPVYYKFKTREKLFDDVVFWLIFSNFLRINDVLINNLEIETYLYDE